MNYDELELLRFLERQAARRCSTACSRAALNAPLASSCGRLFDAVAAAIGLVPRARRPTRARPRCGSRPMVAMRRAARRGRGARLPVRDRRGSTRRGAALHRAAGDVAGPARRSDPATPAPVIAARFHRGLARGHRALVVELARARADAGAALRHRGARPAACFQNRVLLETRRAAPGAPPASTSLLPHQGARPRRRPGPAARRRSPRRVAQQAPKETRMCLGIPGRIVEITDAEAKLGVVDVVGVRRAGQPGLHRRREHPVRAASATGCWCTSASR